MFLYQLSTAGGRLLRGLGFRLAIALLRTCGAADSGQPGSPVPIMADAGPGSAVAVADDAAAAAAAAAEAAAVAEEVRAVAAAADAESGGPGVFAGERLDDMTNIDIVR